MAKTLSERFNDSAKRLFGSLNTDVFRAEARNLCEKFELMWEMADSAAEKVKLTDSLADVFLSITSQIRTQLNVYAIDAQVEAAAKMFDTLRNMDPGFLIQSNVAQLLRAEAKNLRSAAEAQIADLPKFSLTGAANALEVWANLCKNPASPTPKPAP